MSGIPIAFRLTYEDYLALPEGAAYEILEGDLRMTPAPGIRHQRAVGKLFKILEAHINPGNLGEVFTAPVDVILAEETVVQPDLVFVSDARRGLVQERGIFGAPDLMAEVLSTASQRVDRVIKHRLYGRHGVSEFWLVDPEAESIDVFIPGGEETGYIKQGQYTGKDEVRSRVLPALRFTASEIFGGLRS